MTDRLRPALGKLLPALFVAKDAAQAGRPLGSLLEVFEGELDALHAAIRALVDDHSVERGSAAALPLLAELLGANLLGTDPGTNRTVVARSVRWRRRRGTLAALEEILFGTSGWPAEVDEGFRSLLFTQDHRSPTPDRGRLPAVWDPIPLADSLARRAPRADHRRDEARAATEVLASATGGRNVDGVLRALGRADAGRYAVSPRTADLRGWARPEGVLIRTARCFPVELEAIAPGPVLARADGRRVFTLDPVGRGGPMLWRQPLERPDLIPERTARHEPEARPRDVRRAATLLTPTALAADPRAVEESSDLQIAVAGIPLVGPTPVPAPAEPIAMTPAGPAADLRLADPTRPPAGQVWNFVLLASRSDGDRPLLSVSEAGTTGPLVVEDDARSPIEGATLALRVRRTGGLGARRAAGSPSWASEVVSPALGPPRSPSVVVVVGGQPVVVRAEGGMGGSLRLARRPASAAAGWEAVTLEGPLLPPDGLGLGAASTGNDDRLFLVGDDGGGGLGVWRVILTGDATAAVERLDDPAQRRPPARFAPAVCLHNGTLFVFGGFQGGRALGDLWSLPSDAATAGPWRFVHVRQAPARGEATLLPAFGGLALVGGQDRRGLLEATVFHCDPGLARPSWRPLAALLLGGTTPERAPGALVVRAAGPDRLEALVWGDRTRPRLLTLVGRAGSWSAGPLEATPAPSPPASGEALFLPNGELLVVGPPPLPPSEVIFALESQAHLAFLPALDLVDGEQATFEVTGDGSTRRKRPTEEQPTFARGPFAPLDERAGEGRWLGVTGRLGRHRFELRQRILGDADDPALLPDADEVVGLDPRSSRVILPAGVPPGPLTISYVVGRGGPLGAGCLPRDRQPPAFWQEPDAPAPLPPDVPPAPGTVAEAEVSVWLSPPRAGQTLGKEGRERPIVGDLAEGLSAARAVRHPVVAVLGSPRLAPTRLESRTGEGFSVIAADFGSIPMVDAPADVDLPSLALHANAAIGSDADGLVGDPAATLWFAGLWIMGRTDLAIARGRVDFRWCTLGEPGSVALRAAGVGHQGPIGRRSLHPVELELRLYGCQVGVVEIPPWVRLIAAGCTFDGGSGSAPAVRAPGAQVRLRHCTVRGAVEAGELRASSSVFGGPVRVDRADLGWIRYSLMRFGPDQPRTHHCLDRGPSFGSVRPLDPNYLVLADNNGLTALGAGEEGRVPGAFADRSDRQRELLVRTDQHLPIGLRAHHLDRIPLDLARMRRRFQ